MQKVAHDLVCHYQRGIVNVQHAIIQVQYQSWLVNAEISNWHLIHVSLLFPCRCPAQGAAGRRQSTVAKLLRCCRDVETKYLVRTLVQNLRVGAGWKSVLGPLAKAALLHRNMIKAAGLLSTHQDEGQGADGNRVAASTEHAVNSQPPSVPDLAGLTAAAQHAASSAAKVSKQQLASAAAAASSAYHTCPNISIIVDVLMRYGPEGLASRVQLTCGVPVKPMLAKPCTSTDDALQQLAATAAAALTGGKRPGRAAGKKGVVQGLSATPVATAVTDVSAAAAGGGDSSELEDMEADDEVMLLDDGSADDEAVHAAEAAARTAELAGDESAAGEVAAAEAGCVVAGVPVSGGLSIIAEYKYDGQRAQIHVAKDGQVRLVCNHRGVHKQCQFSHDYELVGGTGLEVALRCLPVKHPLH